MTTITINDALADASAVYARQSGRDLSAFVESVLQEKLSALRALSGLGKAPKSVFDMTLEEINVELDAAIQEMREREQAFANGENVPQGVPLASCARSPFDAQDFQRLVREIGEQAKANGTSEMTLDEINAEISAARRERREREQRSA